MKKISIIFILMFGFFTNAGANYEKLAHNFSFKDIEKVM